MPTVVWWGRQFWFILPGINFIKEPLKEHKFSCDCICRTLMMLKCKTNLHVTCTMISNIQYTNLILMSSLTPCSYAYVITPCRANQAYLARAALRGCRRPRATRVSEDPWVRPVPTVGLEAGATRETPETWASPDSM